MLTPNFLENFPQPLTDLYQELESFIIQDIARRLRKAGTVTSTAEYQKIQAELFSMNNITQKVSEILSKSNEQVEQMFEEAALKTIDSENVIYKKAGYKTIDLEKSTALKDYLKATIRQTKGDIENITQSMGFAEKQGNDTIYNSVAKFYQKQLNLAHMQVKTGVLDYNQAIKQATRKIADSGLRSIDYESGYSVNVDTAVRRAVLTSVHQFNQDTINHIFSELVGKDERRFVEVTWHAGARPSHWWGGMVFEWK
jgi:hypothetical protein